MRGLRDLGFITFTLGCASLSLAAKLTQVTSGWENPTKLSFYIYVPDKLAAKPPVIIVVCIHSSLHLRDFMECDR